MAESCKYDLDLTGGLMERIQALIAPPVCEENRAKKKEGLDLHPYYKRPGKGHNHDSCDACKEGGNLLCCDKCPASFHLLCCFPPLEENDIPMGQWLCRRCKVLEQKGGVEMGTRRTRFSLRTEDKTLKKNEQNDRAKRALERAEKRLKTNTEKKPKNLNLYIVKDTFEKVVSVGEEMNPITFELPPELLVRLNMPGDDKILAPGKVGGSRRSSANRKKPHTLDGQGLVPMPVKVCFYCKKSCAKAALLACDYCPLLYHLDCLVPPLTHAPIGYWMCPNHPQHKIDESLWKGAGYSERVALWDSYGTNTVDEHKIKIDFLRKAHQTRYHPFHVNTNLSKRVQVPEYVKQAYAKPLAREPSLRDVLRASVIYEREQERINIEENKNKQYLATVEEQELVLNMAIGFNLEALAKIKQNEKAKKSAIRKTVITDETRNRLNKQTNLTNGRVESTDEENVKTNSKSSDNKEQEPAAVIRKQIKDPIVLLDELSAIVASEIDYSNGDLDHSSSEIDEWTIEQIRSPKLNNSHADQSMYSSTEDSEYEDEKMRIEEIVTKVMEAKIVDDDGEEKERNHKETDNNCVEATEIENSIKKEPILGDSDFEEIVESMDIRLLKFLALKQLKQQVCKNTCNAEETSTPEMTNGTVMVENNQSEVHQANIQLNSDDTEQSNQKEGLPKETNESQHTNNLNDVSHLKDIKLIPLADTKQSGDDLDQNNQPPVCIKRPCPMLRSRTRKLRLKEQKKEFTRGMLVSAPTVKYNYLATIGTKTLVIGKGCNNISPTSPAYLRLRACDDCKCISDVHAKITYDEKTRRYKLINYSPFGTVVDSVLFGPNSSQGRKPKKTSDIKKKIQSIKKLRNKRKRIAKPAVPANAKNLKDVMEASTSSKVQVPARCKCVENHPTAMYEGSVFLNHGCTIRIGCVHFTFSYMCMAGSGSSSDFWPPTERKC